MSENLTLYEIHEGLRYAMEQYEEATTEDQRVEAEALIQAFAEAEVKKGEGIISYLKVAEHMATSAEAEERRHAERKQRWRTRAERLKKWIVLVMQAAGRKSINTPIGSMSVRGNGGAAPLQINFDVLEPHLKIVTAEFNDACFHSFLHYMKTSGAPEPRVIDRKPDMAEIRRRLKAGETVAGVVELERGSHLRIE